MKKMILSLILSLSILPSFANDSSSQARIAELAAHRIEKLINLKKIDSSFSSKIQFLGVEKLAQNTATDPSFLVTVSQFAGTDGTKNQVELYMDDQGKTLSFKVNTGASAQNAPAWPNLNPSSLIENSLHFLLDHGADKADLKPFFDGLLSLELKKVTVNGQDLALFEMHAKDTQQVLNVFLKLDGSFLSYEIK
jgi:hypothetical protein